jgi:hypothetical protein
VTRTRITGGKASGFFLLERNQMVNHRYALITVLLIVLYAIALDGTWTHKSAGKRLTRPSYESNKPKLKRGLVCGGRDNLNDEPHKLGPVERFTTARAKRLRDNTDRLAIEAKAAKHLITYANEKPDGDDLKDTTDDSQDDADESEDTGHESKDAYGDSEDGADDCVE